MRAMFAFDSVVATCTLQGHAEGAEVWEVEKLKLSLRIKGGDPGLNYLGDYLLPSWVVCTR